MLGLWLAIFTSQSTTDTCLYLNKKNLEVIQLGWTSGWFGVVSSQHLVIDELHLAWSWISNNATRTPSGTAWLMRPGLAISTPPGVSTHPTQAKSRAGPGHAVPGRGLFLDQAWPKSVQTDMGKGATHRPNHFRSWVPFRSRTSGNSWYSFRLVTTQLHTK